MSEPNQNNAGGVGKPANNTKANNTKAKNNNVKNNNANSYTNAEKAELERLETPVTSNDVRTAAERAHGSAYELYNKLGRFGNYTDQQAAAQSGYLGSLQAHINHLRDYQQAERDRELARFKASHKLAKDEQKLAKVKGSNWTDEMEDLFQGQIHEQGLDAIDSKIATINDILADLQKYRNAREQKQRNNAARKETERIKAEEERIKAEEQRLKIRANQEAKNQTAKEAVIYSFKETIDTYNKIGTFMMGLTAPLSKGLSLLMAPSLGGAKKFPTNEAFLLSVGRSQRGKRDAVYSIDTLGFPFLLDYQNVSEDSIQEFVSEKTTSEINTQKTDYSDYNKVFDMLLQRLSSKESVETEKGQKIDITRLRNALKTGTVDGTPLPGYDGVKDFISHYFSNYVTSKFNLIGRRVFNAPPVSTNTQQKPTSGIFSMFSRKKGGKRTARKHRKQQKTRKHRK